jgi:hypothetical protein
MWQAPEFVRRIGNAMQAREDPFRGESLPERWVDLIHYLDEKERQEESFTDRSCAHNRRDQDAAGARRFPVRHRLSNALKRGAPRGRAKARRSAFRSEP